LTVTQHHLTELSRFSAAEFPQLMDATDDQSAQSGLSLAQVQSILLSYWKQTLIITVSLILVAAIIIKWMPKSYTAVASLIVNAGNRDPLSARQSPDDMMANYITTQTELMLSSAILLPVVDRLKLTEDKDFTRGFTGNGDINALRDYVQRNLSTALEITQGRGGQLLFVAASDKDPVKAAQIANTLSDVYLEEEQRRINGPAGERAQRYSSELAELRAKAVVAQDKVSEFQQQHGITDLVAANSSTETQALDNLEQQLLTAQSTRRSLEAQTVGQEASTTEVMNSDLIQELKTQLAKQQAQLAQARTVLGPNHPSVLELQSQIADTRASLGGEVQAFSATTATQLSRAKDLEQKLTQALADQRAKVLDLRRLQDEGAKLVVERDSAQAVYKRALDGYDQILFAAIGDNANVSFISRATPPVKPTKPAKKKLMLIGSVLGLLLGIGAPITYELAFDRRLRCRDDIERSFGIPVLAQFEPIGAKPSPA
jgi:uncharacterized protein involved in exopolysaccharide biosynthesis